MAETIFFAHAPQAKSINLALPSIAKLEEN